MRNMDACKEDTPVPHSKQRIRKCATTSSISRSFLQYLNLLKSNRNYRLYFLSHLCLHSGDVIVKIASLGSIEILAPDSGTAISIWVMCDTVPEIIVSPFGGILADRYDRRRSMMILDAIAAVGVLSFIFAHRVGSIYCLYGATIFRASAASLYSPVATSITPMFVTDPEDLKRITALNGSAWSIMFIIGGFLAGDLTALIGVESCYLFDCGTYILSMLCMKYVRGNFDVSIEMVPKQHTIESIFETKASKKLEKGPITRKVIQSIKCCFSPLLHCISPTKSFLSYIFSCGFGALILMKASASATWGSEDVLNVLFSKVEKDEDESNRRLGILYAFQGIGSLIGPILANTFFIDGSRPDTLQSTCIASFFLIIFGWAGISHAPTFELICCFTAVRCIGASTIYLNSTLLLQNLTKRPDMLGRVLANETMLSSLCESIMAYVAGRLEDKGFGKHEIAYLSASIAGLSVTGWSSYHLFGFGAARISSTNSDDEILTCRRASIDTVHSPAMV